MTRVKRGNVAHNSRKKYLKLAKGYIGNNSRLSTFATEQIIQSLNYAYINRKLRKRNFHRFFLLQINRNLKKTNLNYSIFMAKLKISSIFLNSKILALLNNICY